jgi:hypothetical protein
MYPLDRGMWGPTVRVTRLRDELARRVDLEVISGYRGARRGALVRYAFAGRVRGLDGVYVESSSFLPSETDIAFLALARSLSIPILTYVRDAYQAFPDEYPRTTVRRRLGALGFVPAMRMLGRVSNSLAFPTRGLATVVQPGVADPVLIPPGSPAPVEIAHGAAGRRLLYVGNGREEAQGSRRLLTAVGEARDGGAEVELTIVSRPGEEPLPPHPAWLRVLNAEGPGITELLPEVLATVIPRPRTAYNDLALPVKLFEYLAYGRPLLVTDCTEQAAIVSEADAGIIMGDSRAAMRQGVEHMAGADARQLDAWAANAVAAARRNTWASRATAILETLGIAS